jgi:hypothetical protein
MFLLLVTESTQLGIETSADLRCYTRAALEYLRVEFLSRSLLLIAALIVVLLLVAMAFSHLRGKQRFGCDRRRFVFFQPLRYSFLFSFHCLGAECSVALCAVCSVGIDSRIRMDIADFHNWCVVSFRALGTC